MTAELLPIMSFSHAGLRNDALRIGAPARE